jgi:hypothetical protein
MTRSRIAAAGGVVGAKGAATPPVLLLVDAQAVRTADAQASENVRRVRRGDEGFKRFLQRRREPGWAGRQTAGAAFQANTAAKRQPYRAAHSMRRAHILNQSAGGRRKGD